MGENDSSGGAAKSPWGSIQGLIALAIGYGLNRAIWWCWPLLLHRPAPEWVKGVVPQVATAVLAVGVWFGSKAFLRMRTRRSRRTAEAKGDRLTILVAKLGEDAESESARECVIESIRKELGRQVVEVIPAGVRYQLMEGVSEDEAAVRASADARELLRKKHGDLLIWGRLHRVGGKTQIELRFVPISGDETPGERKVFGYGDKLTLDADFGPEMGAALAGLISVQAVPAVTKSGTYLAGVLRPVADRLQVLVGKLPASMRDSDRGKVFFAFGQLQFAIGDQTGEEARLLTATFAFREALRVCRREESPLDWATTQHNLGNALTRLGQREGGMTRLNEAVTAYREALMEFTRERVPLHWAATQSNLGNTLWSLGERESGTKLLAEAIAAFREALKERTRERVPMAWAVTQSNLGNVLRSLGERESGTERLVEAVGACREALKEYTRKNLPLYWAKTQNNLGNALWRLGQRQGGTERLYEAIAAFREALEEFKRKHLPLDWAMTQNNLGNALSTLGERENGSEHFIEAVSAFREVLKERPRERMPLDWAVTQNSLGIALGNLGDRENDTATLHESVAAYREALKERTQERVPLAWASTQNNLGTVLAKIGERESGTERLVEAVEAYEEALKERVLECVPLDWAMTQNNLGISLWKLGEREGSSERLESAVKALEGALLVYRETVPFSENRTRDTLRAVELCLFRLRSSRS